MRKPITSTPSPYHRLHVWIAFGLFFLLAQISLGAWTSANYASLACPDFPTCQGKWLPAFDFQDAFHLSKAFGPNYEGGVLGNEARMTIHFMHRLGALVTFCYLTLLIFKVSRSGLKKESRFLMAFLTFQVLLGVSNVLFQLPLSIAVAHNGVAALLFATLIALNHRSKPRSPVWLFLCLLELAGLSFFLVQLHSESGVF